MLAVSAAGLLPAAHYSPAGAVSSQSIVRHDEAHPAHVAAPTAHVAYAAPAQYSSTASVSSQSILRHDQLHANLVAAAPVHYAAPVTKVIAPAHKVLVSAQAEEYVSTIQPFLW